MSTNVINYLETLPYHPNPKKWESIESLVSRLAGGNGFSSTKKFLLFAGIQSISATTNYRKGLFAKMPQLLNCPEETLLTTTFNGILRRFKGSGQTKLSGSFFTGIISNNLRFCPLCMAENPYHRLSWQFLGLPICVEHKVLLQEVCPSCSTNIPLIPERPTIQFCPHCQYEYSSAISNSVVTEQICADAEQAAKTLVFLLEDRPKITNPMTEILPIHFVGQYFDDLRTQSGLTLTQLSELTNIGTYELGVIEHPKEGVGLQLRHYLSLSKYWKASLETLFLRAEAETAEMILELGIEDKQDVYLCLDKWHEAKLLNRVSSAINELQSKGERVTHGSIANVVGMTATGLVHHHRIRDLIDSVAETSLQNREATSNRRAQEVYTEVEKAIQKLREEQQLVSMKAIVRVTGISQPILSYYPLVAGLINSTRGTLNKVGLEAQRKALLGKVQDVVKELRRQNAIVTKARVARELGVSVSSLRIPEVRDYLDGETKGGMEVRLHGSMEKEEDLLEETIKAVSKIQEQRLVVTKQMVGKIVGVSTAKLNYYPKVREYLQQFIPLTKAGNLRTNNTNEAELMERVLNAISRLSETGEGVTVQNICRIADCSHNTLRKYPAVSEAIANGSTTANKRHPLWRLNREEEINAAVTQALEVLISSGEKVSYPALEEITGIHRSTLYRFETTRNIINPLLSRRNSGYIKLSKEMLIQQVQEAIITLQSQNEKVTKTAVAHILNIERHTLDRYDAVRKIFSGFQDIKPKEEVPPKNNPKPLQPSVNHIPSREEVISATRGAIHELYISKQRISKQAISKITGLSKLTLQLVPEVQLLINAKYQEASQEEFLIAQLREAEMIKDVEEAIDQLKIELKEITAKRVAEIAKVSIGTLKNYALIRQLIEQAKQEQRLQRQAEVQSKVEIAVRHMLQNGETVTVRKVEQITGIGKWIFLELPSLRKLFTETSQSFAREQPEWKERREQELLGQVEAAVDELIASKIPVTRREIAARIGVTDTVLAYYPAVQDLIQNKKQNNQTQKTLLDTEREERVYREVEQIITHMIDSNRAISKNAVIAAATINDRKVVKENKRIDRLIKDAILADKTSRFQIEERELSDKVQDAIEKLTSQGENVTYKAVASILGISYEQLKKYPLVKSMIG